MLSDLELMEHHVNVLFKHDTEKRITAGWCTKKFRWRHQTGECSKVFKYARCKPCREVRTGYRYKS